MAIAVNQKDLVEDVAKAKAEPAKRDPDGAKRRILEAAVADFSNRGFAGARIAEIAERAQVNKRMLYHYFGDKEALFRAVLEKAYSDLREREKALKLEHLPPEEAMRRLVETTWDHFIEHPEFISLLNSENLHRARHVKQSAKARELHSPFSGMIAQILRRGEAAGVFRSGIDPVELYISIAGLGYFYLSNRFTLSVIFDRDLEAPAQLARRRAHMVEVILGYLRPLESRRGS